MDDSISLHKLALLPKLDPAERTLSHVKAQRAYLGFYASEGRAYISSWGNGTGSNVAKDTDKKEMALIHLNTPVLKPRVKRVSKSVISVCSSTKPGEKRHAKNTAAVHLATTKMSKTHNGKQRADKGEKRKTKANKSKSTKRKTQPKKKRNPSLSDNSSTAERLKERRERKRVKRAIVNPPSSSDKENVEEKRSTRKKIPVGFALMHGFTATNVGKNRLTVKPSVNVGVFNKGKASAKTKATKAKASGAKGHAATYFSESKFLNKTKAMTEVDETSCSSISIPSGDTALKIASDKTKEKFDDASSQVSDIKTIPAPSSLQRKPSTASIVWDIELGKSLCSTNQSMSTAPAEKLGSVVLDVTCHGWAKLLDRCDPNPNKTSIVATSRPGTSIRNESEALASIGPSQSASQVITKITLLEKRSQEAQRSKYFQVEPTMSHCEILAESISPPPVHQDDVDHLPAPEASNQPVQDADPAVDFPTEIPDIVSGLQPEPRWDYQEQRAAEVMVSPSDVLDQEQDCNLGAIDINDLFWTPLGESNYFEEPIGEYVNPEDDEIHILEQDYFMSDAAGWELESESRYNFQEFDFNEDLTYDHDCFVDDNIHDDIETGKCYDYVYIPGHEDLHFSETEDAIEIDQNEDSETSGQCLSEISEREDTEQVHRFSQGRALLSGYPLQEVEHSSKRPAHHPRLFSLEADVAKSLRDHWYPQRL